MHLDMQIDEFGYVCSSLRQDQKLEAKRGEGRHVPGTTLLVARLTN
jgi:hypothetical protein